MSNYAARSVPDFLRTSLMLVAVAPSLESAAAMGPEASNESRAAGTVEPSGADAEVPGEALRIAIDPGIDDAEFLPEWIREATAGELSRLSPGVGLEQWVQVELTGTSYRYELQVTAMRDGTRVGEVGEPVRCECTNEQLLKLAEKEVAAAVERLNAPVEPPAVEPPTDEGGGMDHPQPPHPGNHGNDPDMQRYKPTGLGLSGLVVTGLGGASLIAGVITLVRPPVSVERPEYHVKDWRPPGVGLTTGGVIALAGGIAMWVTDLALCRTKGMCGLGARRKRAQASLVPSWRGTGVGLAGRF